MGRPVPFPYGPRPAWPCQAAHAPRACRARGGWVGRGRCRYDARARRGSVARAARRAERRGRGGRGRRGVGGGQGSGSGARRPRGTLCRRAGRSDPRRAQGSPRPPPAHPRRGRVLTEGEDIRRRVDRLRELPTAPVIIQRVVEALDRQEGGPAVAAGTLARHLGLPHPEEVSGAGLLHDLGKVVLYRQAPEAFAAVLDRAAAEGTRFAEAERALLGVDHAEIAGWLLGRWRVPP